jgi:hypothetical protein
MSRATDSPLKLPVKFLLVTSVKKPILGNKVIEMKDNSQDIRFSVEAHLEADVLGHYVQMSEKGLSNKCSNKENGTNNWRGDAFTEMRYMIFVFGLLNN